MGRDPTARRPQSLRIEIETFAEYDGQHTRISLFRSNPIAVDVDATGERAHKDVLERVGREIGTSQTLLGSLSAWLGSLAALILAAGAVWWRLHNFGRKARDDDPKPE